MGSRLKDTRWPHWLLLALLVLLPATPAGTARARPLGGDPAPANPASVKPASTILDSAYDGGRLVFVSNRSGANQIYAMDADGANQINLSGHLGDDIRPRVAADGRIAFLSNRNGSKGLWVMDANGGNQKRLVESTSTITLLDDAPAWSPSGNKLLYVTYDTVSTPTYRLWSIDPTTGNGSVIFNSTTEPFGQPDWSPNGSMIALRWGQFVTGSAIGLLKPDGSGWIHPPSTSSGLVGFNPRFSPLGDRLAFGTHQTPQASPDPTVDGDLYVADVDKLLATGAAQSLRVAPCRVKYTVSLNDGCTASWSPDGRKIATDSYSLQIGSSYFPQIFVVLADGSNAADPLNLSASRQSDFHPAWGLFGKIAPAVFGRYVVYQTGSALGPTNAIEVWDSQTTQTQRIAFTDGRPGALRLAGLVGQWVLYQQEALNSPAYSLYMYDLEKRGTLTVYAAKFGENVNRPSLDPDTGLAVYRVTQPKNQAGFISSFGWVDTLGLSLDGTFAPANSALVAQSAAPSGDVGAANHAINFNETSQYVAYAGKVAMLDLGGMATVLQTTSFAYVGEVPSASSGREGTPLVGLVGLSYPYLAVRARGERGNDKLLVYEVPSQTDTGVYADHVDGPAAFYRNQLFYIQGSTLNSLHISEEFVANENVQRLIAYNVSAFGVAPSIGVVYLDPAGKWDPLLTYGLPVMSTIDSASGDIDFFGPDSGSTPPLGPPGDQLRAASAGGLFEAAATVAPLSAYICPVFFDHARNNIYCQGRGMAPGSPIYYGQLYWTETANEQIKLLNGTTITFRNKSFFRFLPSLTTSEHVAREIGRRVVGRMSNSCLQNLGKDLLDYYDFLKTGDPANPDINTYLKFAKPIGPCSKEIVKAFDGEIKLYKDKKLPVPNILPELKKRFQFVSGSANVITKGLGFIKTVLDLRSHFLFMTGETFNRTLESSFREYLGASAVRSTDIGVFQQYYPRTNAKPDVLLATNQLLLVMLTYLDGGGRGNQPSRPWSQGCFNEMNWRIFYDPTQDTYRIYGNYGIDQTCAATYSYREIASAIAAADGTTFSKGILLPLADEVKYYYEFTLKKIFPSASYLVDGAEEISRIYSSYWPQTVVIDNPSTVTQVQHWNAAKDRGPRSIHVVHDPSGLVTATLLSWSTEYAFDRTLSGGFQSRPQQGMIVLAATNGDNPVAEGFLSNDGPINMSRATIADDILRAASGRDIPVTVWALRPNEAMVVAPSSVVLGAAFSVPMDRVTVEQLGGIRVRFGATTVLDAKVGDLPHSWSESGTILTITPTLTLSPGDHDLTLTLPPGVVAADGRPIQESPFTAAFRVGSVIGPAGGQVTTIDGHRIDIPPGALANPTTITINAAGSFSPPSGWLTADGGSFELGPDGQKFAKPVLFTMPLPVQRPGAVLFRWEGSAWKSIGGTISLDGLTLSASLTGFSRYAAFAPEPPRNLVVSTIYIANASR